MRVGGGEEAGGVGEKSDERSSSLAFRGEEGGGRREEGGGRREDVDEVPELERLGLLRMLEERRGALNEAEEKPLLVLGNALPVLARLLGRRGGCCGSVACGGELLGSLAHLADGSLVEEGVVVLEAERLAERVGALRCLGSGECLGSLRFHIR
jgi:hypothetical protein